VCEVPIIKVTKWIENNNFLHSGDISKSASFNSLATSQMIAYICENDKKKDTGPSTPLPDYIEETNCQQSCSKDDDDLSSNHSFPLSCSNSDTGVYSADPTKTNQMSPYYDENQKCSCGSSLPEYLREASDQSDTGDDSSTDITVSSFSMSNLSLSSGTYQSKRPQDLPITGKYVPCVSDSDGLNLKTNGDSAPQTTNFSCNSKDDDLGLNTATTTIEISESLFGYFDLVSNKGKSEVNISSKSYQSSTNDLFELDNEIDHRITFRK